MNKPQKYSKFDSCPDGETDIYLDWYQADEMDAYIKERLPKDCEWFPDQIGYIASGCSNGEVLDCDFIEFKFCPYCGGKIVEAPKEVSE